VCEKFRRVSSKRAGRARVPIDVNKQEADGTGRDGDLVKDWYHCHVRSGHPTFVVQPLFEFVMKGQALLRASEGHPVDIE
jgi:hypothetical protein